MCVCLWAEPVVAIVEVHTTVHKCIYVYERRTGQGGGSIRRQTNVKTLLTHTHRDTLHGSFAVFEVLGHCSALFSVDRILCTLCAFVCICTGGLKPMVKSRLKLNVISLCLSITIANRLYGVLADNRFILFIFYSSAYGKKWTPY